MGLCYLHLWWYFCCCKPLGLFHLHNLRACVFPSYTMWHIYREKLKWQKWVTHLKGNVKQRKRKGLTFPVKVLSEKKHNWGRVLCGVLIKLVHNFVKFINRSWKVDTSTTLIHFPIREVRYTLEGRKNLKLATKSHETFSTFVKRNRIQENAKFGWSQSFCCKEGPLAQRARELLLNNYKQVSVPLKYLNGVILNVMGIEEKVLSPTFTWDDFAQKHFFQWEPILQ